MITHEPKTRFAERCGVNKATVTRWHQAGRLIVDDAGQVDIDASLHLLESTRGARWDVAERWRAYRAEQGLAEPDQPTGLPGALTSPQPRATPTTAAAKPAQPTATAQPPGAEPDPSEPDADLDLDQIGRRTRIAQMLKEEAIARQKQREDDVLAGTLIRRADVRKDVTDATAIILGAWENLPDRVAPLLTDISDQARIRALLRDEIERLGHEVAAQLQQVDRQHAVNEGEGDL